MFPLWQNASLWTVDQTSNNPFRFVGAAHTNPTFTSDRCFYRQSSTIPTNYNERLMLSTAMEISSTTSNLEQSCGDVDAPGIFAPVEKPVNEITEDMTKVEENPAEASMFQRGNGVGGQASYGNRRLYVGNISNEVTEETLREFFHENGLTPEAIGKVSLRNGYAFVECRDSAMASLAVEKCNMKTFMNTIIRVEAAEKPGYKPRVTGRRATSFVLVKNCPITTMPKDVQAKFSQFGPVTVEHGLNPGSFVVHAVAPKQADMLIAEFNGKNIWGTRMVVQLINESPMSFDGSGDASRMSIPQPRHLPWKNPNGTSVPLMEMDFPRGTTIPASSYATYQSLLQAAAEPPLKILVPNEFVGAVIGRGGATIRSISKTTGARLDIFRNCSRYDVPEKPVTIYGPPEKASKACRRILEIIAQELEHQEEDKGEVTLRMFAQDSYIGRVIGKGGSIIKKIMDESQTKIHISTQSDFMGKENTATNRHYFPPIVERLITIRGSIDGMCKAEEIISEKLREAYQNEIRMYESGFTGPNMPGNNFSSRPYMGAGAASEEGGFPRASAGPGPSRRKFSSRTPFTLSSSPSNDSGGVSQYIPGGTYSTYSSGSSAYLNSVTGTGVWNAENQNNLSRPETVNMYIPDDVVGALIGRKGSNIRQIIQQTGASVKIMEETLFIDDNSVRRVVINGVIDSLFKAQYLIYDKVVEEGKGPANHQIDDIRLTVEMSVPSEMVGRLIGKNGQNIRDIQKNYLCRVKFMTEPDVTVPLGNPGETFVRITGNYNAFLGAQKQIREMLIKAMTRFFHGQMSGGRRKDDSGNSQNTSGNSDEISTTGDSLEQ